MRQKLKIYLTVAYAAIFLVLVSTGALQSQTAAPERVAAPEQTFLTIDGTRG